MVGLLFLTFASSSVCVELGLLILTPFLFGALTNIFFQQFSGGTYLSYCLRWFFKFGEWLVSLGCFVAIVYRGLFVHAMLLLPCTRCLSRFLVVLTTIITFK